VVAALQETHAHEWAGFLRARVEGHGPGAPLGGLARGGWKLVYNDTPNAAIADVEGDQEMDDFSYSVGFKVARDGGKIEEVSWDGPAYRAGLAKDMQLVAVNGGAYTAERLKRAVVAARNGGEALQLLVRQGDAYRTLPVEYRGGLRYPHLERVAGTPDRLTLLLSPRK